MINNQLSFVITKCLLIILCLVCNYFSYAGLIENDGHRDDPKCETDQLNSVNKFAGSSKHSEDEFFSISEAGNETIGCILGDGFVDDPLHEWIFGKDNEKVIASFYSQMTEKKYITDGFGYVDKQYRGAALWLPPGISSSLSLLKKIKVALPVFYSAGINSIKRALDYESDINWLKPKDPHYYLFAIATIKDARKQGVGGNLMKAGLDEVDKNDMPVYLNCSKEENVSFYNKYEFKTIREYNPSNVCPRVWLMWRDARSKRES